MRKKKTHTRTITSGPFTTTNRRNSRLVGGVASVGVASHLASHTRSKRDHRGQSWTTQSSSRPDRRWARLAQWPPFGPFGEMQCSRSRPFLLILRKRNNLVQPSRMPVDGTFSCFQSDIQPAWEDPKNKDGGEVRLWFTKPEALNAVDTGKEGLVG